jgi:hypothetical protein
MVRRFGAPVMDAAGKSARKTSASGAAVSPCTVLVSVQSVA